MEKEPNFITKIFIFYYFGINFVASFCDILIYFILETCEYNDLNINLIVLITGIIGITRSFLTLCFHPIGILYNNSNNFVYYYNYFYIFKYRMY